MFYKYFLLSLLVYNLSIAQQTYIYKPSANIDYKSIKIGDVKELMRNVENELIKFEFKLIVNGNESFFEKSENLVNESKNIQVVSIAKAMSYANDNWFYDSEKSYLQLDTKFMNKAFSVKFDELPNWEIKNEKKTIGGYEVIKAVTTRKFIGSKGVKEKEIEAWFCPDISISHGPMGAVGLPGLVIQLRLQNTIYTLEQIKDETIKIEEPKSDEALSSEQFYLVIDRKVGNFRESINN
jgi:GLPGLI family protein